MTTEKASPAGGHSPRHPKKKAAATAHSKAAPGSQKPKRTRQAATPSPQQEQTGHGFPVVGLGASAGGLEALEAFFAAVPAHCGAAFVVVAHLSPDHVSILPELLQKATHMKVVPAADDMVIQPDSVYVIPPNKDLAAQNGKLRLFPFDSPRGTHLPIDSFLRSLAQDQGSNAIAVILSGTGSDGTLGLKAIKGEVGMVMVQDEDSAKYNGMPRNAIATGLADYVLPPAEMPARLIHYTKHMGCVNRAALAAATEKSPDALHKICAQLLSRTGHDFSEYKRNTVCRRIERRMHVHQIDELDDYVRYLNGSGQEQDILFKELLIGVTRFFRDTEVFDALQRKIIPELLRGLQKDDVLRIWVPGCSTGEEAYSLAIAIHECMEQLQLHFNVQVFGTDIDPTAIKSARAGLFPASIAEDVGAERMKRYFREQNNDFLIEKRIREMVVFAVQDVIKDPPFTKLHLLSCRNLLIYLEPELQRRILPVFHYSLNANGFLLLGSSETIGQGAGLFKERIKKWKIYQRHGPSSTWSTCELPSSRRNHHLDQADASTTVQRAEEASAFQLAESILRESNMPPCVIVDDAGEIIYVHGRTGHFLEPAQGKINVNILEMARPGLKGPLAAALRRVTRERREFTIRDIKVANNGDSVSVNVTVKPIQEQSALKGRLMILFEAAEEPPTLPAGKSRPPRGAARSSGKSRAVTALEDELQSTRENLQTTIEELETSNEELKSTNEELQSTNEELQSTNEELETSKEELQSLNEESITVNVELQSRIDELSKADNDMRNLLDSTAIAVIFLDMELQVKRFTPRATELIPLTNTDIGRPISDLASSLKDVDLVTRGQAVLRDLAVRESEVKSADGSDYVMRIRPYRTSNNVIDGLVYTFEKVSERRRIEELNEDN